MTEAILRTGWGLALLGVLSACASSGASAPRATPPGVIAPRTGDSSAPQAAPPGDKTVSAQDLAGLGRYEKEQTFTGSAFVKDDNLWVYTPRFAELFGMFPKEVDPNLRGIEAAAFRVERLGRQMCGMAGGAENCMPLERCLIDIYVDESQYPLPWVNDQKDDWWGEYSSLRFLATSTERGADPKVPPSVIPNEVIKYTGTLHPFADPDTGREVNVFYNGQMPGNRELDYNFVSVQGYKRKAIAGLTMITLNTGCVYNSQKQWVTFRLESREKIFSPTLKRFHEFQLPAAKSNALMELVRSSNREYYQKFLKLIQERR